MSTGQRFLQTIAIVPATLALAAFFAGCSCNYPSMLMRSSACMAIADYSNNRVLIFDKPYSTGQNAVAVIGQTDFTSGGSGAPTASSLSSPDGVVIDAFESLWVADSTNNRVLHFVPPFQTGMAANLVLGQSDLTSNGAAMPPNASSLWGPTGVTVDSSQNIWVADSNNDRVLQFPRLSIKVGATISASVVIGPGATGAGQSLFVPFGVALDPSGNLWVADSANNRVLEYVPSGSPAVFTSGQNASIVIGQSDFVGQGSCLEGSGEYNCPCGSLGTYCPGFLNFPQRLTFDASGDLWVADTDDNRVLEFVAPFTNGMSATLALGQLDLSVGGGNLASPNTFTNPTSVAFDSSGNLWVTDANNNRGLEFVEPFKTGMSASLVIGQPNLSQGTSATSQNGLSYPQGIAFSP